jgi:uncharacterized OB-fold protein
MDYRCPTCEKNLRWRRLTNITTGLNGTRIFPPTSLCPECGAEVLRNPSPYEPVAKYFFYLYSMLIISSGFSRFAFLKPYAVQLLYLGLVAHLLLEFLVLRTWPRYVPKPLSPAPARPLSPDPIPTT